MRPKSLHHKQRGKRPDCERQGEGRCLRNVLNQAQHVAKEAFLRNMNAEQLGKLIEYDHQPYAGFETGKNGRRYEIGDKTEPEYRGSDQYDAG